jgi:dihydroorotate dehydrogenase
VIYRHLLRPVLFSSPAEIAHQVAMAAMRTVAESPTLTRLLDSQLSVNDPVLAVDAMGLRFAHPIGLAAGLDKDAEAVDAFGALGFAFVEAGTLTAHAQPGNPRPRLFRLPRDRALINRMGFNNGGAEAAARRLAGRVDTRTIVGINIGRSKLVELDRALEDYVRSARLVAPHAHYVTINVSSPNTPGLRDLQAPDNLRPLLARVRDVLDEACTYRRVPLVLKIAPDLADDEIDAIAELALDLHLDGIIATNTTVERPNLSSVAQHIEACGAGGLSGAPLRPRALAVLRRLHARVEGRVTLIASGGIATVDDVWERIQAGASLLQIYTALIYEGPLLARRLALGLAARIRQASAREAQGAPHSG